MLRIGAVPILKTEDILEALNLVPLPARRIQQTAFDLLADERADNIAAPKASASTKPAESSSTGISFPTLPQRQQKLLHMLSQTPQHIDVLARVSELTAGEAGVELTFLELDGLVRRLPGNTYIRTF